MNKFKLTCPECGAEVIMVCPQAAVWELCPGCNKHVWDGYDAMMAEVVRKTPSLVVETAPRMLREIDN